MVVASDEQYTYKVQIPGPRHVLVTAPDMATAESMVKGGIVVSIVEYPSRGPAAAAPRAEGET